MQFFNQKLGGALLGVCAGVAVLVLLALLLSGRLPGLPAWLRLAFNAQSQVAAAVGALESNYTQPGSYTWTAPAGVTEVTVKIVGAGGGGAAGQGPHDDGGCDCSTGGGASAGAVIMQTFAVTPGNDYAVVVGSGGAGAGSPAVGYCPWAWGGSGGGASSFNGVSAAGGGSGGGACLTTSCGGVQGGSSNGSGYGSGGNGNSCSGGGGGGGAGAVLISYNKEFADVSISASPTSTPQGGASTITWSATDPVVAPGSPSATFASSGSVLSNLAQSVTAAPGDGYIYYYGGRTAASASSDVIYRALVANPTALADTGARLPAALRGAILIMPGNGYLYIMGGINGSGAFVTTIYRAPVSTPTVFTAVGNLPTSNVDASQTAQPGDGYVYILGGVTSAGMGSNTIIRASESNPVSWSAVGTLPVNIVTNNSDPVVVGTDGYMYMYSGYMPPYCPQYAGGGYTYYYTCIDPSIYRAPVSSPTSWVDTGYDIPTAPLGMDFASLLVPGDGYVYLVGGHTYTLVQSWNGSSWVASFSQATLDKIYRAPLSDPRALALFATLPATRTSAKVAATPSTMYVFGGRTLNGGQTVTPVNYTNIYSSPRASACAVTGPGLTASTTSGSQSTGALSTLGENIYSLVCNVGTGFTATASTSVMVYSGQVLVGSADASGSETGPNTASFTVGRTGSTTAALAVSYALSGGAVYGTDYTFSSGSATGVTIPAGQASTTITVTPIDDAFLEGDETATLTLQSGAYAVAASPWNAKSVTIADNDSLPPDPIVSGTLKVACVVDGAFFSTCRVKKGAQPTLAWSVTNIGAGQNCALTSSDSNQTPLPSQAGTSEGATFSSAGYVVPAGISKPTTFTLSCTGLAPGSVSVQLVPDFEEI